MFFLLVVALTIIAPPVRAQQTKQGERKAMVTKAGLDPGRLARISARIKEFVDSGAIAGAVTLVARHGVVISLEAVGYQNLETKTPMRTDSVFQIRSMTKPITAVGIMILLEEGRLLLSDPVEKYVPEFRDQLVVDKREGEKVLTTKKPSRPITIRDLLTHTSGMRGAPDMPTKTLAEYVGILAKAPLEFEPGTKFFYSDAGFETLGRIIEVASGQLYEKFLEQRIFRPLGMEDSFFFPPPDKLYRIASRYKLNDGKLQFVKDSLTPIVVMHHPGPSWSMFSTASDMAAFYQMMLNGGIYKGVRILSRASVQAMTVVHTGDFMVNVPWSYGLGWGVYRERPSSGAFPLVSIGSYGHGGLMGTFGWVDPEKDLVGIFMVQQHIFQSKVPLSVIETFMAMTYAAIPDDLKSPTKVSKTGTNPK
ncbi:MAG: serine hydrolase domain-containing protein [Pyrinomonadaceae bacterium]